MPNHKYKVRAKFGSNSRVTTERWLTQDDTFVAERDAETMAKHVLSYNWAVATEVVHTELDENGQIVVGGVLSHFDRDSYD